MPFAAAHGSCTRSVPDAGDPPPGATHLPEPTETRLKVLSAPGTVTGTSRHRWFGSPWQGHWMIAASSAVEAPYTSTHWPDRVVIV